MSGERCRDANLPFEPSIRRGGSGIAIIGRVVTNPFWQNEAKLINVFNGHCVQGDELQPQMSCDGQVPAARAIFSEDDFVLVVTWLGAAPTRWQTTRRSHY